jgi:hypothetical protein
MAPIAVAGGNGLAVDPGEVEVPLTHPAMRLPMVRSASQRSVGLPFKRGSLSSRSLTPNLVARRAGNVWDTIFVTTETEPDSDAQASIASSFL